MYLINGVYEIEQPIYKIQRNGTEPLPDEDLPDVVGWFEDVYRSAKQ